MTGFAKIIPKYTRTVYAHTENSPALVHFPEIQTVRQWMARSAFTDGYLPRLLSHDGAYCLPRGALLGFHVVPGYF